MRMADTVGIVVRRTHPESARLVRRWQRCGQSARALGEALGRGREHLAAPVGREREGVALVEEIGRQALASPPRDVGHEDVRVRSETQFGLRQDDPPAGVAHRGVIELHQLTGEARRAARAASSGARQQRPHAVDDLRDEVLGRVAIALDHRGRRRPALTGRHIASSRSRHLLGGVCKPSRCMRQRVSGSHSLARVRCSYRNTHDP